MMKAKVTDYQKADFEVLVVCDFIPHRVRGRVFI